MGKEHHKEEEIGIKEYKKRHCLISTQGHIYIYIEMPFICPLIGMNEK